MILNRSRFLHIVPLDADRRLAVHAISHLRLTIDAEIDGILHYFSRPRQMPEDMAPLVEALGLPLDTVLNTVAALMDRGLITDHAVTVIAGKALNTEDERLVRGFASRHRFRQDY